MNQRKSRKSLDKRLFYAISREVKSTLVGGSYKADDIAKAHSVSSETVRSIRRAGTWPKFIENKKARRARVAKLQAQRTVKAGSSAASQSSEPSHVMLTRAEYKDLMEMRDIVRELDLWRHLCYKNEVEGLAVKMAPELQVHQTGLVFPPTAPRAVTQKRRSLLRWGRR
jgi:hypothetical protein